MPEKYKDEKIVVKKRQLFLYILISGYFFILALVSLFLFYKISWNILIPIIFVILLSMLFSSGFMFRLYIKAKPYEETLPITKIDRNKWEETVKRDIQKPIESSSRIWILSIISPYPFFVHDKEFFKILEHSFSDVKLLLLDPASEYLPMFSEFRETQDKNIALLEDLKRKYFSERSLEMRFYIDRPIFSMLILDDVIYLSFHSVDVRSPSSIYCIKKQEDNELHQFFYSYFLRSWKSSKSLDYSKEEAQQAD